MDTTVLVVDDEAAIRENLAAFLEDEGLRVHTVESGEKALQCVSAGLKAQVCIMDLRLPGMSGAEAIRAMRRLAPTMTFIMHTGSLPEAVLGELSRNGLGRIPVFKKPVHDMTVLTQAIRLQSRRI